MTSKKRVLIISMLSLWKYIRLCHSSKFSLFLSAYFYLENWAILLRSFLFLHDPAMRARTNAKCFLPLTKILWMFNFPPTFTKISKNSLIVFHVFNKNRAMHCSKSDQFFAPIYGLLV